MCCIFPGPRCLDGGKKRARRRERQLHTAAVWCVQPHYSIHVSESLHSSNLFTPISVFFLQWATLNRSDLFVICAPNPLEYICFLALEKGLRFSLRDLLACLLSASLTLHLCGTSMARSWFHSLLSSHNKIAFLYCWLLRRLQDLPSDELSLQNVRSVLDFA